MCERARDGGKWWSNPILGVNFVELTLDKTFGGDGVSQLEPFQAILEVFRMLSGTLVAQ